MRSEGPPLDRLTHRLSECPGEFLLEPKIGLKGEVRVDAVIYDLLCDLDKARTDQSSVKNLRCGREKIS